MTREALHVTPASAYETDGHYGDGFEDVASCRACGLALLDLFVSSSNWVNRRSEQVSFIDDRTVHRRVSVDFEVPPGPRLLQADGTETCVIPLALLRRRTLVNFDLRDENNRALQLPQLRQNQALMRCLIRAWAEASYRNARGGTIDFTTPIMVNLDHGVSQEQPGTDVIRTLGDWLDGLTDGDQRKLYESYAALERGHGPLRLPRQDPCFMAVVDRLADSFLLLLFLVDAPVGRNRLVKYSYDERLSLRYRRSGFHYEEGDRAAYSESEGPLRIRDEVRYRLGAAAGLTPTVVRFPVPAAEHTASYHFELEAPPGVLIESAALVAGRPNGNPEEPRVHPDAPHADATLPPARDQALEDAAHRFAVDHVVGAQPRVNLHVVDVPFGSLSRAQAKLIVDPRGWEGAMTAAMAATPIL